MKGDHYSFEFHPSFITCEVFIQSLASLQFPISNICDVIVRIFYLIFLIIRFSDGNMKTASLERLQDLG